MINLKNTLFAALSTLSLSACNEIDNRINGCTASYVKPDWNALERDLSSAEARWASQKLTNYTYTFTASNIFAQSVVTVTVIGAEVSAQDAKGRVFSSDEAKQYGPVETLFARLRSSVQNRSSCTDLSVRYDPTYGHPAQVSSAYQKEGIQDGFGGYTVTGLTQIVVDPPPPPR